MKSSARAATAARRKKKERTAKRARKREENARGGRAKRAILRRGAADRATLSRENHPFSFYHPLSFHDPSMLRHSLFIPLTLLLLRSALFRSPFVTVNHPFDAPHESSPSPRRRLEYRNRSVGAKGHGGKRGLVRNKRRRGMWEEMRGPEGSTVAGLVVGVRRASSIKIIFQRAPPPARWYHPEISAL